MKLQITFAKKVAENRIIQHLLFWMVSFFALFRYFTQVPDWGPIDLVYDFLFHLSLVPAVYIHLAVLIPLLLQKRKYIAYFSGLVATLLAGIWLNTFTFDTLADYIFPGYYFVSQYDFYELLLFFLIYLSLTSLLKFSRAWFQQLAYRQRIHQLEREKVDAELATLRAQINPHFLFNTLNNIYSLALEMDPRVPEVILKLSDSMRYVLYESQETYVPLQKEIDYLRNYIDLQRIRLQDEAQVSCHISVGEGAWKIAPMLLITFVENAFKHGVQRESEGAFVDITIGLQAGKLQLHVQNNRSLAEAVPASGNRGIGLENTKKRLEMLYQGKYSWEQTETETAYGINLIIDLNTHATEMPGRG